MTTPSRHWARLPRSLPPARLAGLLALMILAGATEGVGALTLIPLLNLLHTHGGASAAGASSRWLNLSWSLPQALGVFLLVTALAAWLQYLRSVRSTAIQLRWVDSMRERTYAALLRSDYRWLAAHRQSDLASILMGDIGRIGVGLNALLTLCAMSVTSLAYFISACVLSPALGAAAVGLGAVAWRLLAGIRSEALELGQRSSAATRALHAQVHDNLAGVRLTKLVGAEVRQAQAFREATLGVREQQLHFVRSSSRARAATQLAGAGLLSGFIWIGLRYASLPAPELLTLIIIAGRLVPILSSGQQNLHLWLNGLPVLRELEQLIAECDAHVEPIAARAGSVWPLRSEVVLRDVQVQFPHRDRPALEQVSLRLPARTTTALVGPSGAGKSTCADVLAGLLVPDSGELLIDGCALTGQDRLSWRHSVAYVTQDVFLVHDTLRRNLCWPGDDADDAHLKAAIDQAAADFIWDLPQGLDTVIGDRGARLSGGERQRLGLARALLRAPSLLIVDEATSALDAESEERIIDSLRRLHGRLTIVIISHRPAALGLADQAIELVQGRIQPPLLRRA